MKNKRIAELNQIDRKILTLYGFLQKQWNFFNHVSGSDSQNSDEENPD